MTPRWSAPKVVEVSDAAERLVAMLNRDLDLTRGSRASERSLMHQAARFDVLWNEYSMRFVIGPRTAELLAA